MFFAETEETVSEETVSEMVVDPIYYPFTTFTKNGHVSVSHFKRCIYGDRKDNNIKKLVKKLFNFAARPILIISIKYYKLIKNNWIINADNMVGKSQTIKVTVDKSHLFTLGEKMYRESIEFLRELVNNAYDADATRVNIFIGEEQIVVEDNGNGMHEKGLEQFFTIGSEEKKTHSVSPKFGRKRIGQFGIGKFSALSLASEFIVESIKGKNKYSVIFNKMNWQDSEHWELPIHKERASPLEQEGTQVVLNKLTKKINVSEAEKYIRQSVPLRAKKFSVYLNNKKISAKTIPGKIFPIRIPLMYGIIEGEIIVALNSNDVDEPGVETRVRQVLIKREFFGLDKKYHQGLSRICGSINADFLPLMASRTDFVADSEEYKLFYRIMQTELEKILKDIKKLSETKDVKKMNKELQEVMSHLREALLLNPDFIPQGRAVRRLKEEGRSQAAAGITINKDRIQKEDASEREEGEKKSKEKNEKPNIEAKPVVIKRIKLKKLGVSCGIVSLGETGPEVVSQGNMIYINQDHSLYQKFFKKRELLSLHFFRLITQELVLMKKLRITAREAFDWQSKLLKDALHK